MAGHSDARVRPSHLTALLASQRRLTSVLHFRLGLWPLG